MRREKPGLRSYHTMENTFNDSTFPDVSRNEMASNAFEEKLEKLTLLEHDSNIESVPDNSEETVAHLKPINSELKSVCSKWNYKEDTHTHTQSVLQSSENEVLLEEIGMNYTNCDADVYISLQLSESNDATGSQVGQPIMYQNLLDNVAHYVSVTADVEDECKYVDQNIHDSQTSENYDSYNLDTNLDVYNNVENKQEFSSPFEYQDITEAKKSDSNTDSVEDQILCDAEAILDINLVEDKFRTIQENFASIDDYGSKLVRFQDMLFKNGTLKTYLKKNCISDYKKSRVKLLPILKCGNRESVRNIKYVVFKKIRYLCIQLLTWIEVWQMESDNSWIKIYCYRIPKNNELKDICVICGTIHLLIVITLISDRGIHYFKFLEFIKNEEFLKVLVYGSPFKISAKEKEKVFLCGLDGGFFFATAYGGKHFHVYFHTYKFLDEDMKHFPMYMGLAPERLYSLCKVEKKSELILGMGQCIIYLWDFKNNLEVVIQLPGAESLNIEKCIWAISDYGLYFLLVSCIDKGPEIVKLIAVSLIGVYQVLRTFTIQSDQEVKSLNSEFSFVFKEPLMGAISKNGSFIWLSNEDEWYFSWQETSISAIAVTRAKRKKLYFIFLGNDNGCIDCYELKFL